MNDSDALTRDAGFEGFDHFFRNVSFYKRVLLQGSTQTAKLKSELRDSQMRERLSALPGGQRVDRGRVNSAILSKAILSAVGVLLVLQQWWIAIGGLMLLVFVVRPFHSMTQIESMARLWAIKEPVKAEEIEGFSEMYASMASLKAHIRGRNT